MSVPVKTFLRGMHPYQRDILERFDARVARFFVLEWHRRARKTTLMVNLLIREACRWKDRSYIYVAPTLVQARSIVWDDPRMLKAYLPDRNEIGWDTHEQQMAVRFANGSLLRVRGSDKPDSLRGLDAWGVGFDEDSLIDPTVWPEIFRPIIAQDASRWAMFCFTPKGENHATERLAYALDDGNDEWFGMTLRASESGLMPADELVKAREEMPLHLYEQEFECAHVTDEELALITSRMLDDLRQYSPSSKDHRRAVGCDPSLGGDECVMIACEGPHTIAHESIRERDEMKIAGHLGIFARQHKAKIITIDEIGVGGGIASRLLELGYDVLRFNSSEAASDTDRWGNKRAEAWWHVMREVQTHAVDYPDHAELRRQLTAVRLKNINSRGQVMLERKDETKKRLGRSPDDADAYVYCRWGLQYVDDEAGDAYDEYAVAHGDPMAA